MAASSDLEGRLRRLEDRAELNELVARYALAVDDRDFDTLAALFTEDCAFDSVEGARSGREAVVAYYRQRLGSFGPTYHIPHAQTVDFEGDDRAAGTVLAHAELAIDGEAYWIALRYLDRYRREAGRWRFHERRVSQLYAMPLSELPAGLASDLRKRWPGTAPAPADWPAPAGG